MLPGCWRLAHSEALLCADKRPPQGQYDRIVVGASSPPEKMDWLLSLLRPEGGVIVTPVSPSDLRKVTKLSDGTSSTRVISQVRFSNLEASCCTPHALLGTGLSGS